MGETGDEGRDDQQRRHRRHGRHRRHRDGDRIGRNVVALGRSFTAGAEAPSGVITATIKVMKAGRDRGPDPA